MNKLKQRWKISNNFQLVVIIIVFSITGSSAVYLAKPVLEWLGIEKVNFSNTWLSTLFIGYLGFWLSFLSIKYY